MPDVLRLIDAIYESALEPANWPEVLEQSTRYFGARGAQIGNSDLVNSRLSFSLVHGYDWSMDHMRRYERLMAEDPRIAYFSANPFRPVHCRMSLTDEELHASRVYKEVLSVGGVEYSLGVNFGDTDRALSYFLVLRDASMPPFTGQDCEKLAMLIPHLARALRLQRELDTMACAKQVGFSTLDSMALGVLTVDENGHVMFSNDLGARILDRGDGLAVRDGILQGTIECGADLLAHVRLAIRHQGLGRAESRQALRLPRSGSQGAYMLVVSPIRVALGRPPWGAEEEPLAVIFVRDPDVAQETREELLQRFYGLTASEARLTDLLVSGRPLKKAAQMLGLTEASARQYTKQVFRKTGVQRQADLIRKVLALPTGLAPDSTESLAAPSHL
ncbi:MAG: hypothetical protein R3E99_16795 [Burkholderiaceae bacterium]